MYSRRFTRYHAQQSPAPLGIVEAPQGRQRRRCQLRHSLYLWLYSQRRVHDVRTIAPPSRVKYPPDTHESGFCHGMLALSRHRSLVDVGTARATSATSGNTWTAFRSTGPTSQRHTCATSANPASLIVRAHRRCRRRRSAVSPRRLPRLPSRPTTTMTEGRTMTMTGSMPGQPWSECGTGCMAICSISTPLTLAPTPTVVMVSRGSSFGCFPTARSSPKPRTYGCTRLRASISKTTRPPHWTPWARRASSPAVCMAAR